MREAGDPDLSWHLRLPSLTGARSRFRDEPLVQPVRQFSRQPDSLVKQCLALNYQSPDALR
jgi:hypothetical protein